MSKTQEKPETTDPEVEILNKQIVFPPGRHIWRQQGPYLVCKACELHHAVWVGMEHVMVGEKEDGKPILKKV